MKLIVEAYKKFIKLACNIIQIIKIKIMVIKQNLKIFYQVKSKGLFLLLMKNHIT